MKITETGRTLPKSTTFFWGDWLSDPCLWGCSYAAHGLWMKLLCIAALNEGKDYGYALIGGKPVSATDLSNELTTVDEVTRLIDELMNRGVCSQDKRGVIFCRRMVRAQKYRNGNIECDHCGNMFTSRTNSGGKQQRFCSDKCRKAYSRTQPGMNRTRTGHQPDRELCNPLFLFENPKGAVGLQEEDKDKVVVSNNGIRKEESSNKGKERTATNRTKTINRCEMPDDWYPTEAGIAYAQERGYGEPTLSNLIQKCRDYHISKGTLIAGERGLAATWRTWVNNAERFERPERRNGSSLSFADIAKGRWS